MPEIDNFHKTIESNWNITKNSVNATDSRAWIAKRDTYFRDAAAIKLVKASVIATAQISDQKEKQAASQKAVENERIQIISDLETIQREARAEVAKKLSENAENAENAENSEKSENKTSNNLQKDFHTEIGINRKYQSNLAKVLLGENADVNVKKENLENLEVVNELHKNYDVAKEQLITRGKNVEN